MKKSFTLFMALLFLFLLNGMHSIAQTGSPMRRPISPSQPMYLIHIDTWNNADPQKIIDMVPKDILPYVVFNVSISINHNTTDGFIQAEYGYEIAKSWVRTCAENRVWVMVQQASGGIHHFPEFAQDPDMKVWEEFYENYPNFIGFNFAEQFWGFSEPNDPASASWADRINTFTKLMEMSHKYGGYLLMSWCGAYYGANLNPVAIFKRNPEFASICKKYPENFMLCEKFTSRYGFYDIESTSLGAYLSGFSGQYGIRFDETGWTGLDGESDGDPDDSFPVAAGTAPVLEHVMLTGGTILDGPELIMNQSSREISTGSVDGYTTRRWEFFPQFYNISIDMLRKIIDGTVRIPTRQEVIDRTKLVVVNNVTSGSDQDKYSAPTSLFEGLYRMDTNTDPNMLLWNRTWFKKTGRYPAIPTVFELADDKANSFQVKLNKSDYESRWPTVTDKVNELNTLFPKEYTGDIYAGRHENGWVTYNPLKTGLNASGSIPFKYNTADHMEVNYAPYTTAVIKEFSDKLTFYLTNYDPASSALKTDVIKIYGSSSKPSYTFTDRANHQASNITEDWTAGVYTLTVNHNGALDITINCSGTATNRLTSFTQATMQKPAIPPVYTGAQQYEAENFDYKNIGGNITNGSNGDIRNYSGMGYLRFGTNAAASTRVKVSVPRTGKYRISTKYTAPAGAVNTVDLYVNGTKVATPVFAQTASESDWKLSEQIADFNAGEATIMLKANGAGTNELYFDNIVLVSENDIQKYDFTNETPGNAATIPAADLITVHAGSAGIVSNAGTDITSNAFKAYSTETINKTGVADLDLFPVADNYTVTWKEYYSATGSKKGVLLRGASTNAICPFAKDMQQGYLFTVVNNADQTVTLVPYIAGASGISPQTSYTSTFTLAANEPCYYRATALGNQLKFECSKDSLSWEGSTATTFTDATYAKGLTQLLWGFGTDNSSWVMDNITFNSPLLSVSKRELSGFAYNMGQGPSMAQAFTVKGKSLQSDIQLTAPNNYEISLTEASGYTNALSVARVADSVASTTVYVRLKAGLTEATYKGNLAIATHGESQILPLSGLVKITRLYDFESDMATTSASNPPAANITLGTGNTATAGVVSYTDANSQTSKYLKAYTGGQRNATAALDLNLFPSDSRDYSVTWKQVFSSANSDYKNGVLLRGTNPVGTSSTGYVDGIKQGYLFIAYNEKQTRTQFRIYKSTATTGLSSLINAGVDGLKVNPGQTVWYRASVSGTAPINLKFEYSTDGVNWNVGATYTDVSSSYLTGNTQFVWGLGVGTYDFYIDNIAYESSSSSPIINLSQTALADLNYLEGTGPSGSQSFTVSASALTHNLVLTAPDNFELSQNANTGFANTVTLSHTNGALASTTVYARLKAGLANETYQGNIGFSYETIGSDLGNTVLLSGEVQQPGLAVSSSSSLRDFGYVSGGLSVERTLRVSGSNLSANILLNAPLNFEISLSSGTGYQNSLTLIPNSGSVGSTLVFVRLKSGLAVSDYSGNLTVSATGAESKSLNISGTVRSTGLISVSEPVLSGFDYNHYAGGNTPVKSFEVWGNPLEADVTVTAPSNYEVSLSINSGFTSSLVLQQNAGTLSPVTVYVRLKSGLAEATYNESLTLTSASATQSVGVNGSVSWNRVYDFTNDNLNTIAVANNTTIGSGNSATIGVVSYTNSNNQTSNTLRAYSGGNRNATGVVDLDLFPNTATDYSVTWKQNVGSNTDYKVGMLLRGTDPVGTASTGYVQGIKQGYLFIAYRNSGASNTEFRIYPSGSATSLAWLENNPVATLFPAVGETVWYRASVSGNSPVNLKFEYSTDGTNWSIGATASQNGSGIYTTGSTQLVWGLGANNNNFYLDDITFHSDAALPVNLTSFNAKKVGINAQLNWDVVSETDNAGFEIERSNDGKTFGAIGFIAGAGTTQTAKHYSFLDRSPLAENNYYRLKQLDFNGLFKYSEVKAVDFSLSKPFNIYPNPANSFVIVKSNEDGILVIVDATGKAVLKAKIVKSVPSKIDVSKLSSGVYIYQLNAEKGKFIKE